MQSINSRIEGQTGEFGVIGEMLAADGFTLASNWDYDKGFFDRQLDDQAMVFLRIPFVVQRGVLDEADADIELHKPFVLKHIYQTGVDEDVSAYTGPVAAPMLDQFQEPLEKDAEVEPEWVDKAAEVLRTVESRFS
ncbi:YugN family protein [Brevibacillus sp. B_LB10_24]|uniref:YugN family protein n=1 Tax=Brevibacillus sp. B_LB10_24 TaxID=3380645 RepID=UPI0038B73752